MKMSKNYVSKKALQIPLPGGSGRAKTGAVQFQNDWPGLFIRGDTAIVVAKAVRHLQQQFAAECDAQTAHELCALGAIADIVERDINI